MTITKVSIAPKTTKIILSESTSEDSVSLIALDLANQAYNASNTSANLASTSFNKANAANLMAFNIAIGANAFSTAIGSASNSYAQSIGTAGNNYSITLVAAANGWTNTVFGYSNTYAQIVGNASNNWANTKLSNATGTLSGTLTITGDLIARGNVTLGDASTDTIYLNGTTISLGNNQNIDAGTLFIDAVNNKIGIGTTTPSSNLHVVGTANITSNLTVGSALFVANGTLSSPSITFSNNPNTGFFLSNTNEITLSSNGIAIFSFDDSFAGNIFSVTDGNSNITFAIANTGELGLLTDAVRLTSTKVESNTNATFILSSFPANTFIGGKYIITGKKQNDVHISEIILTQNGTNAFWNVYGTSISNTSLYAFSANVSANMVSLLLTPTTNANVIYKILEQRITF